MMQRIFNRAASSIASGAAILGLAGLLSRILGVYRDRLLATTFGAGPSLDAYYAAFRIPDFVFSLLVLGALSAGFIPIFSEYLKKDEKKAWKLAESVLFLLFGSLAILSFILFISAGWITPLIAPGFDAEQIKLTIDLTRIMLLSPIILGISAVFGAVLQTYKRFLAYSLAPIFYNIGIIFGIFFFIEPFGILGLAWGVVLGAILHLIMQAYIVNKVGWRWSFKNIWQPEGMKEIVLLMGPRTASLVILQFNLLVITILATRLQQGSLSIFNFATNLAHVPIGLFGISFAVSAFPVLSKYISDDNHQAFAQTIYKTVSQILFFLVPTAVLFVLFDEQIVRLVYGAGEFDWKSTLLTAKTLLYFVPGIFAQSLMPLLARGFYAQKNTKHPLYASVIGLVATIGFGIWLSKMGVAGLALAYSIASVIQILILVFFLKLKSDTQIKSLQATIWQTVAGSGAMILSIQIVKDLTGPYLDLLTVRGVLLHFILPTIVGGIAYLYTLRAVDNEEFVYYQQIFRGKLRLFEKAFVPTIGAGEEDDSTL